MARGTRPERKEDDVDDAPFSMVGVMSPAPQKAAAGPLAGSSKRIDGLVFVHSSSIR